MQATRLQHYRERLIDERRALVQQRDHVLEAIPEDVHPAGEHEIAPSEGFDIEASLDQTGEAQVREIDAALERLKEGTFGKCVQCEREISEARLEAIPFAMHCVRCEEERQRG